MSAACWKRGAGVLGMALLLNPLATPSAAAEGGGPAAWTEPEVAPSDAEPGSAPQQNLATREESNRGLKKGLRYGTLIGLPAIVLGYGREAWNWGEYSNWRWGHEGFFGADTDVGGTDKMGHAFSCYTITRISHRIFDYTEDGRPVSFAYSMGLAGLIGTGIEVGDAFTGRYGFSFEDITMDYLGILFGALLDYSPKLDALLGYSAQYWPTQAFLDFRNKTVLDIEADSSGWKHMLNLRLAGLAQFGHEVPWYLRIVQLDFGYYSRGYTRFDRKSAEPPRTRNLFAGISLNFQQVSDELLDGRADTLQLISHDVFRYVHLPVGTSTDHMLD